MVRARRAGRVRRAKKWICVHWWRVVRLLTVTRKWHWLWWLKRPVFFDTFFFFFFIIFKYYYIIINKNYYIFLLCKLLYCIFVLINTINNKLFAVVILYFYIKQCVNYHYYTCFSTRFVLSNTLIITIIHVFQLRCFTMCCFTLKMCWYTRF